jgi:hypothetical protein
MLIYEVNLDVDAAVAEDFRKWLYHHMPEVVRLGGFLGSQLYLVEKTPQIVKWSSHYHVSTQEVLDNYLAKHAPALRADGINKFGETFKASRRILQLDNSGGLVEGRDFTMNGGLMVLTSEFLRKRGYCCNSGCRNCPYGD